MSTNMHEEYEDPPDSSSADEEQRTEFEPPVMRRIHHKTNLGARIISNPKLAKSVAEEEEFELERLNKRWSYISANKANSKRTSTYIYCEDVKGGGQVVHSKCRQYLGIVLALITSIAFSLSSLIVKSIPEYHPFSVVVWTFQGIFLPSIPVLLYHRLVKGERVFGSICPFNTRGHYKAAFFILLRALLGAGGIVLRCYSLQFMNMADSTVIAFSSPIFVVIIAWFFLGEKCGVVPILAALLTLVGVGLIAKPPLITGEEDFEKDQLIGTCMSFGCMLLGTFAVVVLRYIREVHFALVTLVYGLVGVIGGLILALATENLELPQGWVHWMYAIAIALLTFVGQSTLTLALKFEQAGPISLVRTSEILFAFLWEFTFLGVTPHWISLVGAVIVMTGVIIITLRKWVSTLPEEHRGRKCCCILLK